MPCKFHNPYNFILTPDRTEEISSSHFAGDYDPSPDEKQENHSRFWPERYTGEISVKLRTATPLFITDASSARQDGGHAIYSCMKEIPATALKGMLSSAYEIITNSRWRVFSEQQHGRRLGFRHSANNSTDLIPGRIEKADSTLFVRLFPGTSSPAPSKSPSDPLYAAWLPSYNAKHGLHNGQFCTGVRLGLYSYGDKFEFWSVDEVNGKTLAPITGNITSRTPSRTITADGYAVISGRTAYGKHDERFFFAAGSSILLPVSPAAAKQWEDLIEDYRSSHQAVNGKIYNPPVSGTVHGQHITSPVYSRLAEGMFVYVKLKPGMTAIETLYPVQISRELGTASVWDCLSDSLKPAESIDSLSPADRLFGWVSKSRTRDGKPRSWKGKLNITSARTADGTDPVHSFSSPVPLSILGSPKPGQARFYLGDSEGMPQRNSIPKLDASYIPGKKLRGRKVYLHHSLEYLSVKNDTYWDAEADDGISREYRRPVEAEQMNRSITGWIPRGRELGFRIYAENLTREELGGIFALLEVLRGSCFRLGFAKPLGLGSVRLSVSGFTLMKGSEIAKVYASLGTEQGKTVTVREIHDCIRDYQRAMCSAYGGCSQEPELFTCSPLLEDYLTHDEIEAFGREWTASVKNEAPDAPLDSLPDSGTIFELAENLRAELEEHYREALKAWQTYDYGWSRLGFIEDFVKSMHGFRDPVIYPRTALTSSEDGYTWFMENERITRERSFAGYSLPRVGEPLKGFD